MNIFQRSLWAFALAAGGSLAMLGLLPARAEPRQPETIERINEHPMIFFVAKGEPGACGAGCSEWIAAEGGFDRQVHVRLRQFLDKLPRTDLPIFFHSTGGIVGPAMAVGSILRAHRMRAGVGHTIPVGCRDTLAIDLACRRLMQSGREFKSRLRESGAVCASSCVYAFVGASTRTVAYVARVGVHRHRTLRFEERPQPWSGSTPPMGEAAITDRLRQYMMRMGVDFGLIDLAEQTESASTHWLARAEIERLGLATDGRFETPWLAYTRPDQGFFVAKSVTAPSGPNPAEYRTATVEFGCAFNLAGHLSVAIRRDLDQAEAQDAMTVRVTSGETVLLASERRSLSNDDVRATSLPAGGLAKATASNSILLKEQSGTWSRETKFSTQGLAHALKSAPEDCRRAD